MISAVAARRSASQDGNTDLARRVGPMAQVFALQLTGDPDRAADVAQHTVVQFLRHLDRYDPDRPLEPWVYQIVRNRVRDLARRRRVRRHQSLDTWLDEGHPEPAPAPGAATATAGGDDPARQAELNDLRRRIWQAVSTLSDAHREIFLLRDHHGLSYREIAETLDIPPGTVMSRLHAARLALRAQLDPPTPPPSGPPTDPDPDPDPGPRSDR